MKDLFSGTSDLIAVVAIVLTIGLGSAVNVETDILRETRDRAITRTRDRVMPRIRDRVIPRIRLAAFQSELREAKREVRRAGQVLRNIACERR